MSQKERGIAGVSLRHVYQQCINKCQLFHYHDNEEFVNLYIEYVSELFNQQNKKLCYCSMDLFFFNYLF